MLALLLIRAGEAVPSERLIDELWGEQPPQRPDTALQVYVSRLRKLLPSGRLLTEGQGYRLAAREDEIDAVRFQRLLEEGRRARLAGESSKASQLLSEAIHLWRGPCLADFAYEPFAQAEIARLEGLHLVAVEERIEADLALGRHAELVGELEALVEGQPLRERPRGQLMLALYRSGRQAEALQAYQEAREVLVDELGIEPGRQLQRLQRAILAQDSSLELDAAGAESETGQRSPGPDAFVGRQREVATLTSALRRAFSGRGGVVLLGGEPGIGKSRLCGEVAAIARARGAHVLVGRCWEAGGAPAYWPWLQSLRSHLRGRDPETLRVELGADAPELAQLLPELREALPDLPDAPPIDDEGARFRLFEALGRFLQRASENGPLVFVLDDLHAADNPSLLLLEFLAGQLDGAPVLVLGAYRDTDVATGGGLEALLSELGRQRGSERLVLRGLSPPETARLVELSADSTPAPKLSLAIHRETEGNPLFVGELVRLLSAEHRLHELEDETELALPEGVSEVIGRRLRRLTPDCRRTLSRAAVLGREFSVEALEQVAGVDEDELLEQLDNALAASVIVDVPGASGRLRFSHALVRDAFYQELSSARRRRLHREVGEALEHLYRADAEAHLAELAHHFLAASPGDRAGKGIDYARRAGDRALALLAHEEAERLYASALDALDASPTEDEALRCELLLALGEARLRAGGDGPPSRGAFLRAAEAARRAGSAEREARAACGYSGRYELRRAAGDPHLVPLLEEALAALGDEDSALRAQLLCRLSGAFLQDPDGGRRVALSHEALEVARRTGDPRQLAYVLEGSWIVLQAPDTIAECLAMEGELLSLSERIDDKLLQFAAHQYSHDTAWTLGDQRTVRDRFAILVRLADELHQSGPHQVVTLVRAMRALWSGDLAAAEQAVEAALQLGDNMWFTAASQNLQLFMLRRDQRRLGELDDTFFGAHAFYSPLLHRCVAAHSHAAVGREPEARRTLEELLQHDLATFHVDAAWLFAVSLLPDVCALLGERDHTATVYELLLPYRERVATVPGQAALGSVARVLGVAATVMSRWDEAVQHFEQAVAIEKRMEARPSLAHTRADYARMPLARERDRDAATARGLLDAAASEYRALGMDAWAEQIASARLMPR